MKILIDFDSTIYPTLEDGIEIYNKKYNEKLKLKDIKNYEVSDKLLECLCEVKYEKGDVYNAIPTIKELCKKHDVYILTASVKTNLMEKLCWIDKYLSEIGFKKTIVAQNKHMIIGDVIIDDYQYNVIGHNAQYRFLINAPYNQNIIESDKLIRINNISDVTKYIGD